MSEFKTSPYSAQLRAAERQMGRIEEERDALRAELNTVKAVLADALAERLPPWLLEIRDNQRDTEALLELMRCDRDDPCDPDGYGHAQTCAVGLLRARFIDGERQRQVDRAHTYAQRHDWGSTNPQSVYERHPELGRGPSPTELPFGRCGHDHPIGDCWRCHGLSPRRDDYA